MGCQAELEATVAELEGEIGGWKTKEADYQAQITALRKKLAKSEKQLSIEKQKQKGMNNRGGRANNNDEKQDSEQAVSHPQCIGSVMSATAIN